MLSSCVDDGVFLQRDSAVDINKYAFRAHRHTGMHTNAPIRVKSIIHQFFHHCSDPHTIKFSNPEVVFITCRQRVAFSPHRLHLQRVLTTGCCVGRHVITMKYYCSSQFEYRCTTHLPPLCRRICYCFVKNRVVLLQTLL